MAPKFIDLQPFIVSDAPPDAKLITQALFTLINANFDNPDDGIKIAQFSTIVQFGGKAGQTLYGHVMDLVYTLHQLQSVILPESDDEWRVLLTAAILHDMNKYLDQPGSTQPFAKIATQETIRATILNFGFDQFLDNYDQYLADIALLIQSHSAHNTVGGGGLIRQPTRYGLGQDRVTALVNVLRAVDTLDLSHDLQERKAKNAFLSHLNSFLASVGRSEQYEFHSHQLVEQRGLLTNILQNALLEQMEHLTGWQSFLLYPDGVAYLGRKGEPYDFDEQTIKSLATAVKAKLDGLTLADPSKLIEQGPQGIKFKPDALKSGLSSEVLWNAVNNVVARRKFKREELEAKARERASEMLRKAPPKDTNQADALRSRLADAASLITGADSQMQAAELLRTYYILLITYAPHIADPWGRLYRLAELPEETDWFYASFDARYDRPYILAGDLTASAEDILDRIVADMRIALPNQATEEQVDPLWVEYLTRYLLIDDHTLISSTGWSDHLQHYMENNHEQCVHCSAPFPTMPWVASDVRSEDLKVQAFSNRLGAGGGEPKKNVCPICRMQFLVEKLNYTEVKGESPLYLHFFPYAFMTRAHAEALKARLASIHQSDEVVAALHIDAETALTTITKKHPLRLKYDLRTKQDKAQPYGMSIPLFSETVGGMITLPLNGAGDNDGERYLYVLLDALVWARVFNMKVVVSKNATPPLPHTNLPHVYLDMMPLVFCGLLPRQEYDYAHDQGAASSLETLHTVLVHLFIAKHLVGDPLKQQETMMKLIRAMGEGPLAIFHAADREMEKAKLSVFMGRDAMPHLKALSDYVAHHTGVHVMPQTHTVLLQMAQIAWSQYLRGTSLKRSPLLYALDEVFDHMHQLSPQLDVETIKAATCRDMFDHLDRISTKGRGRNTQTAVEEFVNLWYGGIVDGVYGGNYQRVLQDEKLLKSAYLFYLQAQIPSKAKDAQVANGHTATDDEDDA